MNYLIEIRAFHDWQEGHPLDAPAVALWYALMYQNNKAGWAPSFTVPVSVLELRSGLNRHTVYRARDCLQKNGRVIFRERPGGQCSEYRLIPFGQYVTAV